jgi:hypothetical protein
MRRTEVSPPDLASQPTLQGRPATQMIRPDAAWVDAVRYAGSA